jgi:hypothetical protein
MRQLLTILFVVFWSWPANAQEQSHWSLYESVQGSTNSAGQVFKLNTDLTYSLSDRFELGGGVPLYFVRNTSDSTSSSGLQSGIGNAYVAVRFRATGPVAFSSSLTGTAPTGNKDKGFSTGKVTVDWNNYVGIPVSRVTPYVNAGVANTVSDTAFFVRPFTSSGIVGHFEGGANLSITPHFSIGSSAYAVVPSGEQRIVSRIVEREVAASNISRGRVAGQSSQTGQTRVFETVVETQGAADLASDHGFSSWMELARSSDMYFQLGYSRSIRYQFDSVFFSIGFNVTSLVRQHKP